MKKWNQAFGKYSTEGSIVLVSLLLFIACANSGAFETKSGGSWPAYDLLGIGFLGVFEGHFSWFANPLLIWSWARLMTKKVKGAQNLSVLALVLALSFLLYPDILVDESGARSEITGYESGYYLWIASIIVMVGGTRMLQIKKK